MQDRFVAPGQIQIADNQAITKEPRVNSASSKLLFLLAVATVFSTPSAAQERPDILLVIADDMDPQHMGYRNPVARTPTVDSLIANGTVFEECWMAPKCAPSLASILMGQHPHEHGRFANRHASGSEPQINLNESFVSCLSEAGYRSYMGGKWWFGDIAEAGFESGETNQGSFVRNGQAHLLDWIDTVEPDENFFVWWAPLLPHLPHNPPQAQLDRIRRGQIVVPDYVDPRDRNEFIEKEHNLLAMTAWMDAGLSDVLGHLHQLGRRDNLLVIFCLDNGWSNGRVSKGSLYEKGLQSPLVFTYNGNIPQGDTRDHLTSFVDIYPTVLDYAGIEHTGHEGQSLRPAIEGTDEVWRSHIVELGYPGIALGNTWYEEAYGIAIRSQEWKLIAYLRNVREEDNAIFRIHHVLTDFPSRNKWDLELFNLESDPYEEHNLVYRPEYRDQLNHFAGLARDWWTARTPKR